MASLRELFEIRTGEWRRFLLLYGLVFLLNTSVVWGRSVSEALFLDRVGVHVLPFMFIADALLTILAVVIYGAFVDRYSNTLLMVAISVIGGVTLVAARIGLAFGSFTILYLFFFLAERVLRALIGVHAWTYIAEFYDTRTAKRHFPLLASGSRTSGILAGLLITPFTLLFNVENLVLAWVVALVGAGLLAWVTTGRLRAEQQPRDETAEIEGVLENMRQGFSYVTGSAFLLFMAGAALTGTMVIYLLDFQAQSLFAQNFASAERLAAFLGLLAVVGNLIALPIQMFFLSRIVGKVGVGNANLIFPGLSALAMGLVVSLGSLPAAIFARIDYDTLRSAFRTPIDSLLYNAVPSTVKGRTRAFNNGLVVPAGALLAGILLLAATGGLVSGQILIVLGVVTAVAYLAAALGARAQYGRSLATMLSGDEMSLFRMGAVEQADPAALKLLHWRLEESEDDDMTIFLLEILYDFEGVDAIDRLLRFARDRSPAVRAGATRILADWITDSDVRDLCLDGLNHQAPRVRQESAAALASAPGADRDDRLLNVFLQMLDDPDQGVQERVIPPLIASGDFYFLAPAVAVLSDWLNDKTNFHNRALGLRVLTKTGSERLVRTLVRYLEDTSPLVRRQAVELIDDLTAQTPIAEARQLGLQTLQSLLTDDDESVRIAAVSGLGHFRTVASSRAIMTALSDSSFDVRRAACDAMQPILKRELQEALDSRDHYLSECAAFILARTNDAGAKRQVVELMEALVTNAYRLTIQNLALDELDTPGIDLLKTTLTEQANDFLERTFWMLISLSDEEEAEAIQRTLQSEVPATRANAAETLEALTSPDLARLVAPFYENLSVREIIERTQVDHELEIPTERQVFQLAWPQLELDANPWDLTRLPDRARQVMRVMLRETEMTHHDLSAAVQTLPKGYRLDPGQLGEVLDALVQEGWLAPPGDEQTDTYKLNLRWKPGGAFAQAIWGTLTDKNLAAFYGSGGWLTAVTIHALVELGTNGGAAQLDSGTLSKAMEATLQETDVPSIVQETIQQGMARLSGNGRKSGEAGMLTTIEKVIFLKQVPFFRTMSTEQLRIFASIGEEQSYEEAERIITEGERGDTLYVIINGKVAIQRRTQRRQGEDITRLAELGPREYFAEMSIFDNQPYSADAVALQRCDLLLVRQAPLVTLIQNQPDLALGLLSVLSMRLRQANELIVERSKTRPKELVDLFDSLD